MNVARRVKVANEARKHRFQRLLDSIAATNNTGLSDETVLAILNADRGPWTEYTSVEEMFADMAIEMTVSVPSDVHN